MENTNQSLFDLDYNENLKIQLRGAAQWAGIAAIVSLAGSLFGLISAFMTRKTAMAYQPEGFRTIDPGAERAGTVFGSVITLILAVLFFYFLNRFATRVKTGLNGNDPGTISEGFASLANYFIVIGVLIIIGLAAFLIVIAGVAAGGGSGA